MRIHYLSEAVITSPSAESVATMRNCEAFARQGHDVTLHVYRGEHTDEEVFAYFGVEPVFRLRRHVIDPAYHDLARISRQVGLRSIPRRIRRLLRERATVAREVQRARPDLVYVRNIVAMAWIAQDRPFIFEAHQPPPPARAWLDRRVLRRGSLVRVVTISDALRRIYLDLYPWLEGRVIVAHDAADDPLGGSPAALRDDRQGRPLRVGYVGSLSPGRGGEIIAGVAQRLPDVEFHVIGGSPDDVATLRAAIVTSNVRLYGHVAPSELPDLYPRMDVLLAPYQRTVTLEGGAGDTSAFMSPMKLFEYLSWGAAIVFSDLPVVREVLQHERDALLVGPDDVDAWVRAIVRLRDEPGLAQRLGSAARQEFLAEHTWDHRARRVLADLELTPS
jgi:glycosyltransferase involved in cell wall biosynthesis